MNERIQELAEQAQAHAEWMTPQGLEWFDNFKQQFAELIVQECSHQVMSTILLEGDCESVAEILMHASFQLKQHFGVEL